MFGCRSLATASASTWNRAGLVGAGVPAPDHLEGDQPVELRLPRLVDDPHAAPAQLVEQLVPREPVRAPPARRPRGREERLAGGDRLGLREVRAVRPRQGQRLRGRRVRNSPGRDERLMAPAVRLPVRARQCLRGRFGASPVRLDRAGQVGPHRGRQEGLTPGGEVRAGRDCLFEGAGERPRGRADQGLLREPVPTGVAPS